MNQPADPSPASTVEYRGVVLEIPADAEKAAHPFTCPVWKCTMGNGAHCAKRWADGQGGAIELFKCRGCPAGAARAALLKVEPTDYDTFRAGGSMPRHDRSPSAIRAKVEDHNRRMKERNMKATEQKEGRVEALAARVLAALQGAEGGSLSPRALTMAIHGPQFTQGEYRAVHDATKVLVAQGKITKGPAGVCRIVNAAPAPSIAEVGGIIHAPRPGATQEDRDAAVAQILAESTPEQASRFTTPLRPGLHSAIEINGLEAGSPEFEGLPNGYVWSPEEQAKAEKRIAELERALADEAGARQLAVGRAEQAEAEVDRWRKEVDEARDFRAKAEADEHAARERLAASEADRSGLINRLDGLERRVVRDVDNHRADMKRVEVERDEARDRCAAAQGQADSAERLIESICGLVGYKLHKNDDDEAVLKGISTALNEPLIECARLRKALADAGERADGWQKNEAAADATALREVRGVVQGYLVREPPIYDEDVADAQDRDVLTMARHAKGLARIAALFEIDPSKYGRLADAVVAKVADLRKRDIAFSTLKAQILEAMRIEHVDAAGDMGPVALVDTVRKMWAWKDSAPHVGDFKAVSPTAHAFIDRLIKAMCAEARGVPAEGFKARPILCAAFDAASAFAREDGTDATAGIVDSLFVDGATRAEEQKAVAALRTALARMEAAWLRAEDKAEYLKGRVATLSGTVAEFHAGLYADACKASREEERAQEAEEDRTYEATIK